MHDRDIAHCDVKVTAPALHEASRSLLFRQSCAPVLLLVRVLACVCLRVAREWRAFAWLSFQLENILLTSADVATAETRLGDFGFATHAHGRSLTNMFHHLDRSFRDEPGIEIVKAHADLATPTLSPVEMVACRAFRARMG